MRADTALTVVKQGLALVLAEVGGGETPTKEMKEATADAEKGSAA